MDELDPEVLAELARRAKAALRKRARALRATIPRSALEERTARIVERLQELLRDARTVALFYPIVGRNEVDLRALDPWLRGRGATVYYPSIDPESRVMTFRVVDDPHAMEERGLGFQEPEPAAVEAALLDVVVVPALLVDPRGYRLGYGAGFYDRTLPRFCPPARSIVVAYDFQLMPEVPSTPHDVSVETIVTDKRILAADARAEPLLSFGGPT